MKRIHNRPTALQGNSSFTTAISNSGDARFCESTAAYIWAIDGPPRFEASAPVAILPARDIKPGSALHAERGALLDAFAGLPVDEYLKDGATFRYRRYGRFALDANKPNGVPRPLLQTDYFQSEAINRYAGGMNRRFPPLTDAMATNPYLHSLITGLFSLIPLEAHPSIRYWEAGVHPTRVVGSTSEAGYGAPEGLHQDGHVYASTVLLRRDNVEGGDSVFADLDKVIFWQKPLEHCGDAALWVDAACWHDVTEILPRLAHGTAIRDIVGISFNPLPDRDIESLGLRDASS